MSKKQPAEPVFVPVHRPDLDDLLERAGTLIAEHVNDRDGTQAAAKIIEESS